jgi:predicted ATPase
MKIDIHTHTKKCKGGDSENRNISPEKFDEIIRLTDVKILAITNHNHFDLAQYDEINEKVKDTCQIWPGIELDIIENDRRAHLIVISNPKNSIAFNEKVQKLLRGKTADNFTISLEDTVSSFDQLDSIYIAHYFGKKPNLLDEDVDKLTSLVQANNRVLKEASNSISAGIFISHGHNSIYGSDVQNWHDYQETSKSLPDLRLPVESFEQFCLLLEKDNATINTILDKKTPEPLHLNVFGVAELIDLDIYNDINVLFGSKGTGKTEILRSISKHYNDIGFENTVYESNTLKLEEVYDLKGRNYDAESSIFEIDNCYDELSRLRSVTEKNVTSLSSYLRYFSVDETNRISRDLKIKNYTQEDSSSPERDFDEIRNIYDRFEQFLDFIESDQILTDVVGEELITELKDILNRISVKLKSASQEKFTDLKSISLFNQIITVFVEEIARKTGQPQKPISTGFKEYASNRIKIERDLIKINESISQQIAPNIDYVGDLGEKGHLHCQTNVKIQNGSIVDTNYQPVKNVNKNPQKFVASALGILPNHIYANSLFEKINELKQIDNSDTITSISDLLLFYRHFTIDEEQYTPSTGESSMVLLHNELMEDKEIYLIDEPEKSLGNDYISNVIVPILKQHALSGKKIIIATHDANIAVRTLPYNSIYREHDANGYYTYLGNPFTNSLKCKIEEKEDLDWKEISMKTLEGGRNAFGERGKIYGNT